MHEPDKQIGVSMFIAAKNYLDFEPVSVAYDHVHLVERHSKAYGFHFCLSCLHYPRHKDILAFSTIYGEKTDYFIDSNQNRNFLE